MPRTQLKSSDVWGNTADEHTDLDDFFKIDIADADSALSATQCVGDGCVLAAANLETFDGAHDHNNNRDPEPDPAEVRAEEEIGRLVPDASSPAPGSIIMTHCIGNRTVYTNCGGHTMPEGYRKRIEESDFVTKLSDSFMSILENQTRKEFVYNVEEISVKKMVRMIENHANFFGGSRVTALPPRECFRELADFARALDCGSVSDGSLKDSISVDEDLEMQLADNISVDEDLEMELADVYQVSDFV
jgi:hypothetical protein